MPDLTESEMRMAARKLKSGLASELASALEQRRELAEALQAILNESSVIIGPGAENAELNRQRAKEALRKAGY